MGLICLLGFLVTQILSLLFPCEICCKKVRGKKENNLMFLVSLSLLLSTEFSPMFHAHLLPSGSKNDSNFIMIIIIVVCPTCVKNFTQNSKNPKTHYSPECSQIPIQKTHSHIQKKSSHKFQTKKESRIHKQTQTNNNNKIRTRPNKEVSAKSVAKILSSFYPTISSSTNVMNVILIRYKVCAHYLHTSFASTHLSCRADWLCLSSHRTSQAPWPFIHSFIHPYLITKVFLCSINKETF